MRLLGCLFCFFVLSLLANAQISDSITVQDNRSVIILQDNRSINFQQNNIQQNNLLGSFIHKTPK